MASGDDVLKDPGRLPGLIVGGSGTDERGRSLGENLGEAGKVSSTVSSTVGYGRRGRPTKNPRTNIFQLRLTKDEIDLLDLVSYATEDSKSDVIRKALKMYASVKKSAY